MTELLHAAERLGADAVFPKPLSPAVLADTILRLLQARPPA